MGPFAAAAAWLYGVGAKSTLRSVEVWPISRSFGVGVHQPVKAFGVEEGDHYSLVLRPDGTPQELVLKPAGWEVIDSVIQVWVIYGLIAAAVGAIVVAWFMYWDLNINTPEARAARLDAIDREFDDGAYRRESD